MFHILARRMAATALTALLAVPALPAAAQDAALALGIGRYEQMANVGRATEVVEAMEGLERLGFRVSSVPNARSGNAISALQTWLETSEEAERVVAVLAGRFLNDGARSWMLTADAGEPGLFGLGDRAISLESVLRVLARHPGRAILLLAPADGADDLAPFLREGIGPLVVPQGVTVMTGPPATIAAFVEDEIAVPGRDLIDAVAGYDRIDVTGYMPERLVFVPRNVAAAQALTAPPPPSGTERALWEGARALDTVGAYRNYLDRYPRGTWRRDAEDAVAAIQAEPNRDARLAEERMDLSSDERRAVQEDLTLLGYRTRGVDGIFGSGTRTALRNWQQENGFAQTGYLTPEQIVRLEAQSARVEAERAAEADRQRVERERLDRAYWDETGSRGTLAGLSAYLERYPEGIFAETARTRRGELQAAEAERADQADRADWQRAQQAGDAAAFRSYLQSHPEGRFAARARQRLDELGRPSREVEAAERALGLNTLTVRLIEQRLARLGLEPGEVDGRIDGDTRRALRAYQNDHDLNETGFLDQGTLVRLIADGLDALR